MIVTLPKLCELTGMTKRQVRHQQYTYWNEGWEWAKVDGKLVFYYQRIQDRWQQGFEASDQRETESRSPTPEPVPQDPSPSLRSRLKPISNGHLETAASS